ncbi:MAG TPA: transcriptional regulator [Allosphingosinicella sp.]
MAEANPFDHSAIDDVIHGRLRLGVVAYLLTVDSALFTELRDKVGATDGNLSVHLKKLEEAGYVGVEKKFVSRKPQTRIRLTSAGRSAWLEWLARMEAIAASTRQPTSRI